MTREQLMKFLQEASEYVGLIYTQDIRLYGAKYVTWLRDRANGLTVAPPPYEGNQMYALSVATLRKRLDNIATRCLTNTPACNSCGVFESPTGGLVQCGKCGSWLCFSHSISHTGECPTLKGRAI